MHTVVSVPDPIHPPSCSGVLAANSLQLPHSTKLLPCPAEAQAQEVPPLEANSQQLTEVGNKGSPLALGLGKDNSAVQLMLQSPPLHQAEDRFHLTSPLCPALSHSPP